VRTTLASIRSQSVVAVALIATVASVGVASAQQRDALRPVESFASISDTTERSRALFIEAGKVIHSPRCLNCHPTGDRPSQGMEMRLHVPLVTRGSDSKGGGTLRCATCHHVINYPQAGIPGHPMWQLAPLSMAWQTKSLGQICEQIKDKRANGGKTLAQLHEHMAHDSLVGWAWNPGPRRNPAPGTQEEFGKLIEAWIATGAACPVL
jgi:hypothetical protein